MLWQIYIILFGRQVCPSMPVAIVQKIVEVNQLQIKNIEVQRSITNIVSVQVVKEVQVIKKLERINIVPVIVMNPGLEYNEQIEIQQIIKLEQYQPCNQKQKIVPIDICIQKIVQIQTTLQIPVLKQIINTIEVSDGQQVIEQIQQKLVILTTTKQNIIEVLSQQNITVKVLDIHEIVKTVYCDVDLIVSVNKSDSADAVPIKKKVVKVCKNELSIGPQKVVQVQVIVQRLSEKIIAIEKMVEKPVVVERRIDIIKKI